MAAFQLGLEDSYSARKSVLISSYWGVYLHNTVVTHHEAEAVIAVG